MPVFSAVRYTQGGRLDTTFDGDGISRVDVAPGGDRANAVALVEHGGLVLAGSTAAGGRDEWAMIRLGPRGHLDPTFSRHGRLVTDFGPAFDEAQSLAVQTNGRLVVAGRIREGNKDDIGVLRLQARWRPRSHVRKRRSDPHGRLEWQRHRPRRGRCTERQDRRGGRGERRSDPPLRRSSATSPT